MLWIEDIPVADPAYSGVTMLAPLGVSALHTEAPTPGEDPQHILSSEPVPFRVAVNRHESGRFDGDGTVNPDTVNAEQNGFSTGFTPSSVKRGRLTGAVLDPPKSAQLQAMTLVGNVGRTNRLAALYAGVKDQTANYLPSSQDQMLSLFNMYGSPVVAEKGGPTDG